MHASSAVQLFLLAVLIIGYLYRCYRRIEINPKLPQKRFLHGEVDGKKKIRINPATKWHLVEALYLYILWDLFGVQKNSSPRRIRMIQKVGLSLTSFLVAIGSFTLCVHADMDHVKKNFQIAEVKQTKPKQEEPKQEKSVLVQRKPIQSDPKPQTNSKNKFDQNHKPVAQAKEQAREKENKLQFKEIKHKELNEQIHRIDQNLRQIEKEINEIEEKLPDTNTPQYRSPLRETIKGVRETLGEVTKEVNELKEQIPIVNELQRQIPILR